MERGDKSLCSQTFFVSQRTKSNKLSLSQNNVNRSKTAVKSKSAKSLGRGRLGSTSKSRHGGVQLPLSTMEKYLDREIKDAKSTTREPACIENELAKVSDEDASEQNNSPTRKSPSPDSYTGKGTETSMSKSNIGCSFTKSTESALLLSLQLESDCDVERSCNDNCNMEDIVEEEARVSKKENVNILMCPLCWKPFESKDSQITHMKACAIKNKVPTKKLLEAFELIKRQEAERQALGLPLLANKVPKNVKKDFSTSIKPKNVSDGYLQLGLALSASLTEAEKEKERDHLLEAGLYEEAEDKGLLPVQDVSDESFAKPAPIFLNAGRRCGNEGRLTSKRKRIIKHGLGREPTLLKRTEEERERLITEKVAIILVGEDSGVPEKNESSDDTGKFHLVWEVTSEELKMYANKENVWWTLASVSPSSVSQNQYYVKDLSAFISPSKCAAGSKLMHLSQIPGRNRTPTKSSAMQICNKENKYKSENESLVLGSKEVEPSTVVPPKKTLKRSLFDHVSKHFERNTLSCDWEMLMGKSEMSDVTVYTQENRRIPAHKLVFYVRCPNILEDIITEEIRGGESSALLFWNDICFHSAWTFLKYIYCGVWCDLSAMKVNVIEGVYELAERYHVVELLRLLKETNSFLKSIVNIPMGKTNVSNQRSDASHNLLNPRGDSNLMKCEESKREANFSNVKDQQETSSGNPETKNVTKDPSIEKEPHATGEDGYVQHDKVLNNSPFSPSVSVTGGNSPDLFHVSSLHSPDSPRSIMIIEERTENVENYDAKELSQESRASIEYLVSLMEKDTEDSGNTLKPHNSQDCNITNDISVEEPIDISSAVAAHCPEGEKTGAGSPKTPSVKNKTSELIVYPTPSVSEKVSCRTYSQISTTNVKSPCKDIKRKFVNLERSDTSTPATKKLCFTENTVDFSIKNPVDTDKEVVVDLTLSSPEEEAAGKLVLNVSDVSTIPDPCSISHGGSMVGERAVPDDNLSIPDGMSYISNVWDDFDPVPEAGGYVVFEKSVLDVNAGCLKKSPIKTIENLENEGIIYGDNEKKSALKELYVAEEIPEASQCSSKKKDETVENEDGVILPGSSLHNTVPPPSNSEDGCDITDRLLNASLQRIDNSIFWRDENEPIEVISCNEGTSGPCQIPVHAQLGPLSSKDTPVNRTKYISIHTANVTPIADYSAMKTPALHKELDRYGIKHLKRNQAKKILRHIYNELHPVVSGGGESPGKVMNTTNSEEKISQITSQKQQKNQAQKTRYPSENGNIESLDSDSDEHSSGESSDGSSDSIILEESVCEQFESPVKDFTLSQKARTVDIPTAMKELIRSNPALHRKILLYEPIWLDEIKVALKENGAKFNTNQLMNYLDEKCITFRLARGNRHKRKRCAKKISLSQPCNSKGGRNASISSSQPC